MISLFQVHPINYVICYTIPRIYRLSLLESTSDSSLSVMPSGTDPTCTLVCSLMVLLAMNVLAKMLDDILVWLTFLRTARTGTTNDLDALVFTATRLRTEDTIARPANMIDS